MGVRPSQVSVEEVTGGKPLVRFIDLPQSLYGGDPRWAPPVRAWERYRLDARRNPFFDAGEAVYLLARSLGRPAGRITAHVAEPGGEGRFGFWATVDEPAVVTPLVDAAQAWLVEQGCTSMTGPWSFEPDDEPGLLVAGYEAAGLTGRPWHPPHLAQCLEAAGLHPVADHPTWRHHLEPVHPSQLVEEVQQERCTTSTSSGGGGGLPGQAGPYVDRRIVLDGIAAVPDIADALRTSGLRSAWGLARRARTADWDTCTVVRCDGDPARLVPSLLDAAAAAGYRTVIAPWSADPAAPPEAVHRTYRRSW
ncbi:MAG: hypothetical protein Q8K58_08990 [Acidimicrobiales bacterium]|nr:hypothetical protein [Acidimicrobiales bacterium]